MQRQFPAGGYPGELEHHRGGAVPDHDFPFFAECFQYGHQVDVVRFLRVLLEDRHGVAAGEYQGVEFVFASFEVGDHVVGDQRDARIAFDLFRIRYGEYFAGNPVFIKCFQVLEQAEPVYRIDGHDSYFLCHDV